MFKNMKLATKLYIGFGVILALTCFLTIMSYRGSSNGFEGFTKYRASARHNNLAGLIQAKILKTRIIVMEFLINKSDYDLQELNNDNTVKEFIISKIDHNLQQFDNEKKLIQELLAEGKKEILEPDRAKLMALIIEKFSEYDKTFQDLAQSVKQGGAGVKKLDSINLEDKLNSLGQAIASTSDEIKLSIKEEQDELGPRVKTDFEWNTKLLIIISLINLAASIILAFFIARAITKPIHRVIAGLTEGADQVASASGQISSSSQSLAEGASEQAASIEETSASIEEMSSMTKQNAANAGQANSLMGEAKQMVGTANESMGNLTESMKEISKASEETAKIIKTIDEIAFQTNLLALNAAVEAARAGEAGAGFAVVADEVRNLAMRAADAAKNTANLIEGTVKKVKDGSQLVTRTNEAFVEVAKSSAKVGSLVAEIAAASNEQAQGIDQVNKAVAEMDKVVQQNAANAEESASASEEMNAQAQEMKGFVEELATLVGGHVNGNGNTYHKPGRLSLSKGNHKSALKIPHKNIKAAAFVSKEVDPKKLIPMGDEEFKDF